MNLLEELRTLDPRDPGRWPFPFRVGAVVLAFLVVTGLLVYYFVWSEQRPELQQHEAEEQALRTEFKTKHAKAVNLEVYKQQLKDIERSFGALLRQLPGKTEVPSLLVDISQTGLGAGLQEKLFQPEAEVKKDFYAEKPGAAFRAQMYFLMERQKRMREGLAGDAPGPVLSDFLMEKDRIFANLNLDDEELKLYERFYEVMTAEMPQPDLVIYLQAKPEVLRARIAKKKAAEESRIAPAYVEEVARAYEHFFFHYEGADLLVVDTSEIDFVERSEDLQQLLKRLQEPVKGTQYYLPLGGD
jgi:deoxyadenosine/deoxycytidine kinase